MYVYAFIYLYIYVRSYICVYMYLYNAATCQRVNFVGRGGSVVSSVPCVQKVAGLNPTLAAM